MDKCIIIKVELNCYCRGLLMQNNKCLLFFEGNIKQQNIVNFMTGNDKDNYDIRYLTN